jgi:hypothetical protein
MLAARENNALHLADIFPVFSWHNGHVGGHNFSLLADALWSLVPGLDLYLQAAYDDISAADLLGLPDTELPTIDAYLLGLAWETGLASRPLSLTLEAGITHYLWGNFHAYDYALDKGNYLARAVYRYRSQRGVHLLPLTSPYGPGARWLDLRFTLGPARADGTGGTAGTAARAAAGVAADAAAAGPAAFFNRLSLELEFSYLDRLEGASLISVDYEADKAVENGPRMRSFSSDLSLAYSWAAGPRSSAALYAGLGVYGVEGQWWPEFRLGGRWRGVFLSGR